MNTTDYSLHPRSGTWAPELPSRLLAFDMTVERGGRPLGGHNVQLVLRSPDYDLPDWRNTGLDDEPALTLDSGWRITLRNQFAEAPDVAASILQSAAVALSTETARASDARGEETTALWNQLRETAFAATGPDYW